MAGGWGNQDCPWKLRPPILPGFHIFWDTKGLQKVLADASVFLKALDSLHYPS